MLRSFAKFTVSCIGKVRRVSQSSRYTSRTFDKWKQTRNDILSSGNIELLRLDCLNPAKAVPHDIKSGRYVHAESSCDSPLGKMVNVNKNVYPVVNVGVRDGIRALCGLLNINNYCMYIPNDVYPVYKSIVSQSNLEYTSYISTSKTFIDIFEQLSCQERSISGNKQCVLITSPHTPTGQLITNNDINAICEWLNNDSSRLVVIDCVYMYDSTLYKMFNRLYETQQVITCNSLSKSFLQSSQFGVMHMPNKLKSWKDSLCVSVTSPNFGSDLEPLDPSLPQTQQAIFREKWIELESTLKTIDPNWVPPDNGYLSILPINHKELYMKHGILGVPSEVFNDDLSNVNSSSIVDSDYSIVSCLYDNYSERKKYHVVRASNFSKCYDKYSSTYDKINIKQSTFMDKFFLLDSDDINMGIDKLLNSKSFNENNDELLILETDIPHDQTIHYKKLENGTYDKK